MFIRKLVISSPELGVIRDIEFSPGMNLIVDDTPSSDTRKTGNNVGKTTVLKLIYFCFGDDGREIYTDDETSRNTYEDVRTFLIENEVLVTLSLVDSFSSPCRTVVLERNFLRGNGKICRINGSDVKSGDYETELRKQFFPMLEAGKPTFKQIISHNIRYRDISINNTLRTLSSYTGDVEYEALYLFLLGLSYSDGGRKKAVTDLLEKEKTYRSRIEGKRSLSDYEYSLSVLLEEITGLEEKKNLLSLNKDFSSDLDRLNTVRYEINKTTSLLSNLETRRNAILASKALIDRELSSFNYDRLSAVYRESKAEIPSLEKKFSDLVEYHNRMLHERASFILNDLPSINERMAQSQDKLDSLLAEEKVLSGEITKQDSFGELESLIREMNEKHNVRGKIENTIALIRESLNKTEELENQLKAIDDYLYSDEFESRLNTQVEKFNRFFRRVSNELYGESYALTYRKEVNRKGNRVYRFDAFNLNMSSGKKQGEILSFDLAYILFARSEGMTHMGFLLNDKKELMHGNQLEKVAAFVNSNDIQLVVSILRDKLPSSVMNVSNTVLRLSQEDKLFRIENLK